MSGKEKFYGLGRSETAYQKRNQQLQKWEKSVTNKEPAYISSKRKRPRVKFGESVVFLAAAQSGDLEEVERLITEEKADVNSVNKDGLTALHQVEWREGGRGGGGGGGVWVWDMHVSRAHMGTRNGMEREGRGGEGRGGEGRGGERTRSRRGRGYE